MQKSNLWQLLLNNIPTLIATIIGVSGMIVGICDVWHALSPSRQIIAGVMGGIVVVALVIFIYGQLRKTLYVIPTILHRMHIRSYELAMQLRPELNEKDLVDLLSLIHIDSTEFVLSVLSVEAEQLKEVVAPQLLEMTVSQTEKAQEEKEAPQRIFWFFYEKVGLKEALEKDKKYQHLEQQLDKVWLHDVPTTEISTAIGEYKSTSRVICTLLPIVQASDTQTLQLIPLSRRLDIPRKIEEVETTMKGALAKVRESIDKYYNRSKDTPKTEG